MLALLTCSSASFTAPPRAPTASVARSRSRSVELGLFDQVPNPFANAPELAVWPSSQIYILTSADRRATFVGRRKTATSTQRAKARLRRRMSRRKRPNAGGRKKSFGGRLRKQQPTLAQHRHGCQRAGSGEMKMQSRTHLSRGELGEGWSAWATVDGAVRWFDVLPWLPGAGVPTPRPPSPAPRVESAVACFRAPPPSRAPCSSVLFCVLNSDRPRHALGPA